MNCLGFVNGFVLTGFSVIIVATNSSCTPPQYEEQEIRCHPPLERVIAGPGEILVYPDATADWRSLVVLPEVEDIRFAVTFDQARGIWGAPDVVSKGIRESSETYIGARRKVSVVWSRQSSGSDTFKSWYLYVYPRDAQVQESFHRSLTQCLPTGNALGRSTLVIMDPRHRRPALSAEISDGNVESLLWFPPPPPTVLPPPE